MKNPQSWRVGGEYIEERHPAAAFAAQRTVMPWHAIGMKERVFDDPDEEYDHVLHDWIYRYNAYDRLGASLSAAIEPMRTRLEESGELPVGAGIDALKGWAFALARHHYQEECEGGTLIQCHPELKLILKAIRNHRAAGIDDLPPMRRGAELKKSSDRAVEDEPDGS